MFTHLEVSSAYSFLEGPCRIKDLVARAASLGFKAMALTDRDSLAGLPAFLEAAGEAGLRPIIGARLSVEGGRLLALVEDETGFGNLCELVSAVRDPEAFPEARAAGEGGNATNAVLPAFVASRAAGLVLASYEPGLLEALAGLCSSWPALARPGALYGALSPRRLSALRAARRLGLPVLASGEVAFLERGDRETQRLLRAIALGTTVGRVGEGELDPPEALLFGPGEAESLFSSWPEALRANEEVAERCRLEKPFRGFIFPAWEVPGTRSAQDPRAEDSGQRLRRLVYEGAERRWGEIPDAIVDRLEYELDLIGRKGFTDYFLVVAEIAGFTSRICGRGSGAASAVAYSLGITNVDPIRHHLWFERFLNEARPDPPDIDLDFAWDERDAIIRRAIERFGPERAARVANHNSFGARAAFREAARAWGMGEGETAAFAREAFEGGGGAAGRAESWPEPWPAVLRAAKSIEGLPRGLSMHCGGLVIAPDAIRRHAPVERSAEGYPLLQWEKDGTEAAGLVKIDLLGNRSLAVIRDAVANLACEGVTVPSGADFERLALGDTETRDMLARGDTMGVFYIESPAMRQLQKKAGVGDYDHIVIHSSIIRPAANRYIEAYVRRLHGEEWQPLHPLLAKVLDETFGIMVYQEDVSKAAMVLAGFDEAQADGLRKILAKKNKAARLAEYREAFVAGARARCVDDGTIDKVWEMMESFAGYSFCKPHSASYAVVSFQSAWLRRHHPAEFMAAVISNGGGFYTCLAYVSEARRMGLSVEGPDVAESRWRWTARGGRVVVGLMAVGGLSKAAAERIVEEREAGGPFLDLGDAARRLLSGPGSPGAHCEGLAPLEEAELLALVEAGAFDSLPLPRERAGAARTAQARFLLGARNARAAFGRRAASGELAFDAETAPAPAAAARTTQAKGQAREAAELEAEFAVLGFLRDRHPLDLWKRAIAAIERVMVAELPKRLGGRATVVCMPVTRKEVETSGGEEMAFVSLEDESAIVEAVLFPEAWERFARLLFDTRPLVVTGRVEDDLGALSFEIEGVRPLLGAPLPRRLAAAMPRQGLSVPPGHGQVGQVQPGHGRAASPTLDQQRCAGL